ncbi:unnamed protein product, partial [Didymodactylos carnosus]
MNPVE